MDARLKGSAATSTAPTAPLKRCVFCEIVSGSRLAHIVDETDNVIASHFHLHVFPRRVGIALHEAVVRQEPEVPVDDQILASSASRLLRALKALATL